ncbi:hypothetical protein BLNAU_23581 [Blattamonas nauphoetae]|uniref:Uncharacterized protein n=1 Tax=Blattamonas nauphoetae TaxID=2049346 RepID=A0ABQ9WQ98_9EUKA|nr:hypothetical protein BLNAU_23581 [Blattamonas nauphoetae]
MTKDSGADVGLTPTLSTSQETHPDLTRQIVQILAVFDPCSVAAHALPLAFPLPSPHSVLRVLEVIHSKRQHICIRVSYSGLILSPFLMCPQIVPRRPSSPALHDALVAWLLVALIVIIIIVHPTQLLAERACLKGGTSTRLLVPTASLAHRPSHSPPQSTRPTSALQWQLPHSTRGSVGVLLHSPPLASTQPSSPPCEIRQLTDMSSADVANVNSKHLLILAALRLRGTVRNAHTSDARQALPRLSIQPSTPILLSHRSIIVECGRADVTQLLGRPFQTPLAESALLSSPPQPTTSVLPCKCDVRTTLPHLCIIVRHEFISSIAGSRSKLLLRRRLSRTACLWKALHRWMDDNKTWKFVLFVIIW